MSIDNTLELQKVSSLLDRFSQELHQAKVEYNTHDARQALVDLAYGLLGGAREKRNLFLAGRRDSLDFCFGESNDPVYQAGYQSGAIEQKYWF